MEKIRKGERTDQIIFLSDSQLKEITELVNKLVNNGKYVREAVSPNSKNKVTVERYRTGDKGWIITAEKQVKRKRGSTLEEYNEFS